MASLALSIVGTAVGGPIGGMIGASIGGMIDNVLFPTPKPATPPITASTYGNAIPLVYGPKTRLGVNLIWTSGFYHQIKKNDWKFLLGLGGALKSETSMVVADLAFAVAAGPLMPGWCVKIWANGAVLFDSTAGTGQPTPDGNGVVTWTKSFLTYQYFDAITVYPGNSLQQQDPTIESHLGSDTPAYRGTAYIVIKGLQVAQYGGSVPVINVQVEAAPSVTIGQVVLDICERSGIPANFVSTSALQTALQGYQLNSQSTGIAALEPLALCFDFDIAEVGGGLRFTPRGYPPYACILNDQLAGHVYNDAQPDAFQWPRDAETTLPKVAALTFNDPARDCNANTQASQRLTGSANSNLSATVLITLDATAAKKITDRMLWEAQIGRQRFEAPADDRLIWVEPARSYCVESPAGFERVRMTKAARGANGVLELTGKRDYTDIYFSTATGIEANQQPNTLAISGPVNPPFFIEPPSGFPGLTQPTLMIALSGGEHGIANDAWQGCSVFVSTNDADYALVGQQLGPAMMGVLSDTLVAHHGGNPDTTTLLDVDMTMSGTEPPAVSVYDAGIGQTPYYAGGEFLTATTVQGLGGDTYRLTNLWRALYGTSSGGTRPPGAPFVRIDGSVFQMPLPKAYIGVPLYFRFVGVGEALPDVVTYEYTGSGSGYGTATGGLPQPTVATALPNVQQGQIAWSPNPAADNVTAYLVYRATGLSQLFASAAVIAEVAGSATTFTDNTAAAATGYTYFVVARNVVGDSAPSNGANLTTPTAALDAAGFTFSDSGLYLANEFLGAGSWPTSVTFTNGDPRSAVNVAPGSAPTGTAVFRITDQSLTVLGTITIAAGGLSGTVAWTTSPYVHPAGARMLLYAPFTQDPTLANVSGRVSGLGG